MHDVKYLYSAFVWGFLYVKLIFSFLFLSI